MELKAVIPRSCANCGLFKSSAVKAASESSWLAMLLAATDEEAAAALAAADLPEVPDEIEAFVEAEVEGFVEEEGVEVVTPNCERLAPESPAPVSPDKPNA